MPHGTPIRLICSKRNARAVLVRTLERQTRQENPGYPQYLNVPTEKFDAYLIVFTTYIPMENSHVTDTPHQVEIPPIWL